MKTPIPSSSTPPFSRLIGLRYHDGPIEGFAQRSGDDGLFSFTMVDCDDGQDLRVFEVHRNDGVTFDEMLVSLGGDSATRRRYWFPPTPVTEAQKLLIAEVKRASTLISVVVAYDLSQSIIAARDIDEKFAYPPDGDWLRYFGLSRDARIT